MIRICQYIGNRTCSYENNIKLNIRYVDSEQFENINTNEIIKKH